MLADTELPISKDLAFQSSFVSHFKHGLLFNQSLMISDAQAVNSANFRQLIQTDDNFKELISSKLLSIAVRHTNPNQSPSRLTDVRNAFLREKKQNLPIDYFVRDDDLDFLNENCTLTPYTYKDLRESYTNNIFELFNSEKAKEHFAPDAHKIILERLFIERERDKGLGRVFMQKNLEQDLAGIGQSNIWQEYKDVIIQFSDAPYVTGLPKVLSSNPIYSPLHKNSFDLAFPKKASVQIPREKIAISTDLHLSTYEKALEKLTIEDILFLRQTRAFKTYIRYVTGGVTEEADFNNAIDSLIAYQTEIDQYIVRKHLGKATGKNSKLSRYLEPILKMTQEAGVFSFGLTLTDIASSGALTISNMFANGAIDLVKSRNAVKMQREHHKLITELSANDTAKKIRAEKLTSGEFNETIYSSVSIE